jgi:hypothetical protein
MYDSAMWDAALGRRGELSAILVLGAIALVIFGLFILRYSGPATIEFAKVTGFGPPNTRWADDTAVMVTTADGRLFQLTTRPELLRHCSIGSRIRIVRRPRALYVAPSGCL